MTKGFSAAQSLYDHMLPEDTDHDCDSTLTCIECKKDFDPYEVIAVMGQECPTSECQGFLEDKPCSKCGNNIK